MKDPVTNQQTQTQRTLRPQRETPATPGIHSSWVNVIEGVSDMVLQEYAGTFPRQRLWFEAQTESFRNSNFL